MESGETPGRIFDRVCSFNVIGAERICQLAPRSEIARPVVYFPDLISPDINRTFPSLVKSYIYTLLRLTDILIPFVSGLQIKGNLFERAGF